MSLTDIWQKFIRYWNSSNHSVLVLGGLCVVLVFVVYNLGGKVKAVRGELLSEKTKIERLEIIDRDYRAAEAAVANINKYPDIFEQLVPDRDGVLNKIKILEEVAVRTGNSQSIVIKESPPDQKVKPKSAFQNSDAKLPKDFSGVDFTLTLNGNFTALINYLNMIESQPVVIDFAKMTIRADQTNAPLGGVSRYINQGTITTSIEGTIFYKK